MTKRKRVRGNGEGSIITLNGKRKKPYAVRITIGWNEEGKQRYKYLSYHASKTEAKNALRDYMSNPYDLEHKDVTLYEVFEKFMNTNPAAPSTMTGYRSSIKKCEALHDKPIREIKVGHIENIMKNHTPAAQKSLKGMLNKMFRYALKYEILDKNIIDLVETESLESKSHDPFTPKQIKEILEYDKHDMIYTLKIMLYTGVRIAELLELRNENVFLDDGYMIGGLKTAAGKDRIIPIHDEIKLLIKKLHDPKNKYLIVDHRKHQISYRYFLMYIWDPIKKDLGFPQTPHSTRHTFVTNALKCGSDRHLIQKIVGHKGDITSRYDHNDIAQLKLEINKLHYN